MKAFHEVRRYATEFMVWHKSYKDISFLAHWHKEIEMIYIRSGSAKLSVTDQSFYAKAGDLVICDSGDIHYSDSYQMDNCLDFLIFDTNLISSHYTNSHFQHPCVTKEQLEAYGLFDMLERLLDLIDDEMENQEPYYQDVVTASIRQFFYLLKRNVPTSDTAMQSQNRRLVMLEDLQQLLSYMEEHYMENITLEFAAGRMHFSESHFSKIFKKLTGINFVIYLNMIRVEKAADLLRTSNDKITDIAFNCGFNNVRTFNRVFKEMTGYTPTEFSAMPDKGAYNLAYYKHKSTEKQYMDKEPMTIIKNTEIMQ